MQRRILFLSGLDFKQKSIQVIRKTPEAYAARGWHVRYIVARDASRTGNYFYEQPIDPPGVQVTRIYYPFAALRERGRGILVNILTRIAAVIITMRLAWCGAREIRRGGPYDIVYGYEYTGVLAAALARVILAMSFHRGSIRWVSRFQGTAVRWQARGRSLWLEMIKKFDQVIAAYLPSDLCIMTDDGTQGLDYLRWLGTKARRVLFYVNGVDPLVPAAATAVSDDVIHPGIRSGDTVIMCVSRLVRWKRVDRAIHAFHRILTTQDMAAAMSPLKLLIVGEGNERRDLETLVDRLGLREHVVFAGGVPHSDVGRLLERADYFFSFYDLSNVGNPLLEAIRYHKVIFTLANGDTANWIQHGRNGFLFDPDDATLSDRVAEAFRSLTSNPGLRSSILNGVRELESERLWSWEERMEAEIRAVGALHAA